MTVENRPFPPWAQRQEFRVGAVVAVALAIGLVVWLVAIRGGGGESGSCKAKTGTIPPTAFSPDCLRSLAKQADRPIYWIGPAANTNYELTKTASGRIFVRYLTKGVAIGANDPSFTFIGTYPFPNAYRTLRGLAKKSTDTSFAAPADGLAVYATDRPTNIYLAYPGSNIEIEVYDPTPSRARSLIREGRVAPVQ
jgi:hypothetical protein